MTVIELVEILSELPGDLEVVLQKDAEGNGYSPLYGVDSNTIYKKETDWSGEVLSTEWTAEEVDMEEGEWEDLKSRTPRCCVLHPTN